MDADADKGDQEVLAALDDARARVFGALDEARINNARMEEKFSEARNAARNHPGSEISEETNWENVGKLQFVRRERITTANELKHLAQKADPSKAW